MYSNIDQSHPDVRNDLFTWITWLGTQVKLGGFRIDAGKHISKRFMRDFVQQARNTVGKNWFVVCEYWDGDGVLLAQVVDELDEEQHLFDVSLWFNLVNMCKTPEDEMADLRELFKRTLTEMKPHRSVVSCCGRPCPHSQPVSNQPSCVQTFVNNHDTVSTSKALYGTKNGKRMLTVAAARGADPICKLPRRVLQHESGTHQALATPLDLA